MPFTVYDHGLGFYVLELRQGGLEMDTVMTYYNNKDVKSSDNQ